MLLVDTSVPGTSGSMSRYAGLVELALVGASTSIPGMVVRTKNIAFPFRLPGWLPESVRTWVNHLWLFTAGRWSVRQSPADVVHLLDGSYAYVLRGVARTPLVITVHDVIPLLQSKTPGVRQPSYLARSVISRSVRALHTCNHLVSVSVNTLKDLAEHGGIGAQRITVIPNAVDSGLSRWAHDYSEEPGRNHPRQPGYILHIGNNSHYKNRAGVLRIFALLRKEFDARLIMAGPPPAPNLLKLVQELGLNERVEFVHHPDNEALAGLYAHAGVLLFPSVYEGFGWPPLEAMALGCPVVCSDAASLPEVVGDAALLALASDEGKLAELCGAVLTDPVLRHDLVRRGKERAALFTVERMGRQLLEVYQQVQRD